MNWYAEKVSFIPLCPNVHPSPPPMYMKPLFINLIILTDTSKYEYVILFPPPYPLITHCSLLLESFSLYCLSLPIKEKQNIFHKGVLINFIKSAAWTDGERDLLGIDVGLMIKSNNRVSTRVRVLMNLDS